MIYVSKDRLDQVEYLIQQSIQGNHVLFDAETVRRVFKGHPPGFGSFNKSLDDEEAYSMEHHIERLIELPTLREKRVYLERLDKDTFEKVVRTYFNIVENNLYEAVGAAH